jgi:hypothetical protein
LGRNPESGEPYLTGIIDEHIGRLHILMYQAAPMKLADCRRQANSDVQEATQVYGLRVVLLKNAVQWLTARIL